MTRDGTFDWAGAPFLAVGLFDAERMRGPGLFAFVRRLGRDERIMLFVDHAECVAAGVEAAHARRIEAAGLGMNELHVCLRARERIDRLILHRHLVRRVQPILNLVGEEAEPPDELKALCA